MQLQTAVSEEPSAFLSAAAAADFGYRPLIARHTLQHNALFADSALIDLLDQVPRRHLFALTMGSDPERSDENQSAIHDHVSGAELLRAVQKGRLWLNITQVDQADPRYRVLIDHLYGDLAAQAPGFAPSATRATLLLSSPDAMVYYHADGPASVLWHIRGRKRVWVYPALDEHYMQRELLEDIIAGVRHEYLPYQHGYDSGAQVFDLEPGEWIAWPHNAPHRVSNLEGVNVSLSTEHFTTATRRRMRLYKANRYFRLRFGRKDLSARETGVVSALKILTHQLARRVGLDPVLHKQQQPTLRIDADAPRGVSALPQAPQQDAR